MSSWPWCGGGGGPPFAGQDAGELGAEIGAASGYGGQFVEERLQPFVLGEQ
jgi:hypothetical protein